MHPLTLDEIVTAIGGRPCHALRSCSISGVSTDSRHIRVGDLFFALRGEHLDGHDFVRQALSAGALYAVVSQPERFADDPHLARLISVDDTTAALGRLAAYHRRQISANVIAVTGSNGKTTTKAMIAAVLSAKKRGRSSPKSYNNVIGVPLTLLSAAADDDFLVVEIGSNAPGEIDHLAALAAPDIAVITSIGPAHLEGFTDLQGVLQEKCALLNHVEEGGLAVVNIDHPPLRERLGDFGHLKVVTYGHHAQADLRITALVSDGRQVRFEVNGRYEISIPVPGRHNASNALAAVAVGLRNGLTVGDIAAQLQQFALPDMRLQIQQYGSLMVINDSYNANPASMRAAIEVLEHMNVPGRRVAIIGDMRELGTQSQALHEELGRLLGESNIDVLLTVGQYARIVGDAAARVQRRRIVVHASTCTADLQGRIGQFLKTDDSILLKGSRALQLETMIASIRVIACDEGQPCSTIC